MRRRLAGFIMWQWKKMSHLSAVLYWWIYDKINGNGR